MTTEAHHYTTAQLQAMAAKALQARAMRDPRWRQLLERLQHRTGFTASSIEHRIELIYLGVFA